VSQTSDGSEQIPPRGGRPPWLGPVIIGAGLILLALICIALSVWGP
jgi:hypothetical protein